MSKKLYVLALTAIKLDPEQTITGRYEDGFIASNTTPAGAAENNIHMHFSAATSSMLANSEDEALEEGLELAKELWPESDGYTMQRAYWGLIPEEQVLLAAASIEGSMLESEAPEEREM